MTVVFAFGGVVSPSLKLRMTDGGTIACLPLEGKTIIQRLLRAFEDNSMEFDFSRAFIP